MKTRTITLPFTWSVVKKVSLSTWLFFLVAFVGEVYFFNRISAGTYSPIQSFLFLCSILVGIISFIILCVAVIFQYRLYKIALLAIFMLFWTGGILFAGFYLGLHSAASPALVYLPLGSVLKGATDTVAYVSNVRKNNSLQPLKENSILDRVAKIKACDMENNNYFSHEDKQGRMSWHLFTENGYNYLLAGENLAENPIGDNSTMEQLLTSPEHRDNILNSNYTEIGVGYCGRYYVEEFGVTK